MEENIEISEEEENKILIEFYEKLNKKCEEENISVMGFFLGGDDIENSYPDKIQLSKFSEGLTKLGYVEEKEDEGNIIMKKFQNPLQTNYINILLIEKKCKDYKNNPIKLNTFTEFPVQTLKTLLKPKNQQSENIDNEEKKIEEKKSEHDDNENKEIIDNNIEENELSKSGIKGYIKVINEKIDNERERIINEMNESAKYKILKIYSKFKEVLNTNEKMEEFEKKFYSIDSLLSGNISKENFNNILDEVILLSTEDLNIIFNEIPNTGQKLYQYIYFINNVKNINENIHWKEEKIFNLIHNSYINEIRNNIKNNKIDIRNIWVDSFNGELVCNKSNFNLLIEKYKLGNFHPLEIDYIFSVLSFDKKILFYKDFNTIINGNEEEINNLNFDKYYNLKKKQNEKEGKEEEEEEEEEKKEEEKEEEEKEEEEEKKEEEKEEEEGKKWIDDNPEIREYHIEKDKIESFIPTKYLVSNVRNKLYEDELKFISEDRHEDIINNRIKYSNERVTNILQKHEKYNLCKTYRKLYQIFKKLNTSPLDYIKLLKEKGKTYLTLPQMLKLLNNNLNIELSESELSLLLNSLKNKDETNTFFSHEEFFLNINDYKFYFSKEMKNIIRECQLNFNDYLIDFKNFIIANEINLIIYYNEIYETDYYFITYDEFYNLCNLIGYHLTHDNELIFIFNTLSKDKKKEKLYKLDLFSFLEEKTLSENEFIEKGKCQSFPLNNPMLTWQKTIPKYGETKKKFYKNLYLPFEDLFKLIERQAIKNKIYDLTNYFCATNEIDKNGFIPKITFRKVLLTLGINSNNKLNELIIYLEDETDKNKFKLCIFLSIYYLFCPKEGKKALQKKVSLTIELPKTKELNLLYGKKIKKTEIVFKNKLREFSQEDIDQIKILCKFIADIIHNEDNMSITSFFNKYDKNNKKYFTNEELRFIFDEELGIDMGDNLMDIFIDFVTEDRLINNSLIIKIKKLTSVIIGYCGKDEPETIGDKILGNIQSTILSTVIQSNFGNLTPSMSRLENNNSSNDKK